MPAVGPASKPKKPPVKDTTKDTRSTIEKFIDEAADAATAVIRAGTGTAAGIAAGLTGGYVGRTQAAAGVEDTGAVAQVGQVVETALSAPRQNTATIVEYPFKRVAPVVAKYAPTAIGVATVLTGSGMTYTPQTEEQLQGTVFKGQGVLGQIEQIGADTGESLAVGAYPYREFVARPLSTAFLAANTRYAQEGDGTFFDTDTWARGWKDARNVSPAQSLYGLVGDKVDGTQGSDKIDWSNAEEVDAYFSYGSQKWITFAGDAAATIFLDPLFLGAKAAGAGVRKYGNVPVTKKTMPGMVRSIDEATTGGVKNQWTSTINFFKRNINNDTALLAHPIISGNPDLMRTINASTIKARETGNDSYIGEALKVGIGDVAAVDKALYDSNYLASDLGVLTGQRNLVNDSIKILETSSTPLATKLISSYKNKVTEIEKRLAETQSEYDIVKRISDQTPGKIQRVTVSKFERVNARRIEKAENFAGSYWHTQDVGSGARVLHYLEPSSMLREKPSNFAEVGGIVGDRSHLEFAARLREWSKLTGKDPKIAERYFNIYLNTALNKTDKWDMLENFNTKAMRDIIIARLKESGKITREEQDLVVKLADHISKSSAAHKKILMRHVTDNNYMINDGSGSHIFIKQMKDYEETAAKEIAQNRAGAGAKVTADDLSQARKIVRDSMENIQTGSSQIPNMHYSTDLVAFDNIISENITSLRAIIKDVQRNPEINKLNPEEIWDEFAANKSYELLESEALLSLGVEIPRKLYDTSINGLDNLYNNIWKPLTLASLHYTSRNVTEGWQRAVATSFELSRDTGMPVRRILMDSVSSGITSRTLGNRAIKHDAKAAQKQLQRARKSIAGEEYKYNTELADSLYASTDSYMSSLHESSVQSEILQESYNRYTNPDGTPRKIKRLTGAPQDILDHMADHVLRLTNNTNLPADVNKPLFDSLSFDELSNDNGIEAFQILADTDSVTILKTFAEQQRRISIERDYLDNVITSDGFSALPPEMQTGLASIDSHLNQMQIQVGSLTTVALAKAEALGKLDELISRTDVLNNITKSAEGSFDLFPGFPVPDAFAGVIGAIMRQETSAVLNSTRTVFNLDRVTTQNILNGNVRTGLIHPLQTTIDGGQVTNPGWAEIAADHANRRVRDASIQRLMQIDVADDAAVAGVISWAKGSTPEAKDWRALMRISIDRLRVEGFSDPITDIITRNKFFVDGHLPEIGLDGKVIDPVIGPDGNYLLDAKGDYVPGLRQKALDGELTAEDMLTIPERQRTSTSGDIALEGNSGKWKTITTWLFKNIGSKPEDFFSRHPFYTMMYRTEFRRIAGLWKDQGRTEQYLNANLDKLKQASHEFAYKGLMERMYSVERRTDPGQFLRFISPFYMAKQNSNRFWLGYALRNPQAAVRYFQLWSSPTRVFNVEDENGKEVDSVNPFAPAGASMKFTVPASVAKYLGIPEDSRFTSQISSWDLINNGTYPGVPEVGGPVFTRSTGWLLNKLSGTDYDPEAMLIKLGLKPQLLQKAIMPFYQKQNQDSPRDALLNTIVDVNSWMSSLMKSTRGSSVGLVQGIGELIEPSSVDAFNSRLVKNYIVLQEEWLGNQDPEVTVTKDQQAKQIAEMLTQAAGMTTHEFLLESFFSIAPTVGNVKIEDTAVRMSKELRQFQKEHGQDLGKTKYIQFLAGNKTGEAAYRAAFIAQYTPREQNQFGILATPQTLGNVMKNRELFDKLSELSEGKDNFADSKLLGALFNAGDAATDYTLVANNKLFTEGIKKAITDPKKQTYSMAVESGNAQYFAVLDYVNAQAAMENPPVKPGSDLYEVKYKKQLEQAKTIIGNKNPAWLSDQSALDTGRAQSNVDIINITLNDSKFLRTVGENNPLILSVFNYMKKRQALVERRTRLSNSPKVNIYTSGNYADVVRSKEELAEELISKNPDFQQFYNYYLARDPLLPPR